MPDRETRNRQARENAAYKKKNQRCVRCGKQDAFTLNGRSYCADCAEYDSQCKRNIDYAKRRQEYHERKENGLCVKCGHPLPEGHSKAHCPKCLERAKRHAEHRRREKGVPTWDYRRDSGMCFFCMKEKSIPGKKTCPSCYEIMADRMAKARSIQSNRNHPWRKRNECLKNS